jgi:hypothetical protein
MTTKNLMLCVRHRTRPAPGRLTRIYQLCIFIGAFHCVVVAVGAVVVVVGSSSR